MSQFFQIHPDNPQQRLVDKAVEIIKGGGVIVYPTDSGYALGCCLGNKAAMERIRNIRQVDAKHNFTLVCRDLSEIALYAKVENSVYRLIKNHTPGPYTFILKATKEVPRRLQNPKRKTIGLRVPDNPIAQALLDTLGEPLMSSTLMLPGDRHPGGWRSPPANGSPSHRRRRGRNRRRSAGWEACSSWLESVVTSRPTRWTARP